MKPRVSYPIADAGGGRAVAIEEAGSGESYRCFGCQAPMVAKRGSQRAWHFAHKPPLRGCGDSDRALHETAKALIVQGFAEAQNRDAEYRVGFSCRDCGDDLSWNIARPETRISAERTVVEGTRSDVVVDRGDRPPLIIEVVVSHDLEPATRLRYENAELPVFVVHPAWDTVTGLARAVIADVVMNVPATRCAPCQDAEDRRQRELAEAESWAQSMLRGLQAGAAEPAGSASPNVRPWRHDKFGREMYPRVLRRVRRNAAILQRLGFVQSAAKPWLFSFRLPKGGGVIYANFGSTEEVPIWEDPSALIHWQLKRRSAAEEDALVPLFLQMLRAAGAEVRVSFYDRQFDK